MPVYVFDSSAVIRYIDNESGAERIVSILKSCVAGRSRICMSAVQWGEVAGNIRKRAGATEETRILSLLPSEIEIISAAAHNAVRAAALKVDHKISYADAFALDLAMQSADHVLLTADYVFKAVEDLVRIEFLPPK
jgi:predicted nucleic acid-binding protein